MNTMIRHSDCYPNMHRGAVELAPFDSCPGCGHQVILHTRERSCAACEQMAVLMASVDAALAVLKLTDGTPTAWSAAQSAPKQCPDTYSFNAHEYECIHSQYHSGMHQGDVGGHTLTWPPGYTQHPRPATVADFAPQPSTW